jgi:hypothetical protein
MSEHRAPPKSSKTCLAETIPIDFRENAVPIGYEKPEWRYPVTIHRASLRNRIMSVDPRQTTGAVTIP